jgi:hypothetical protein
MDEHPGSNRFGLQLARHANPERVTKRPASLATDAGRDSVLVVKL